METPTTTADPYVAEQRIPSLFEADRESGEGHHRGSDDERGRRHNDVDHPLHRISALGRRGNGNLDDAASSFPHEHRIRWRGVCIGKQRQQPAANNDGQLAEGVDGLALNSARAFCRSMTAILPLSKSLSAQQS